MNTLKTVIIALVAAMAFAAPATAHCEGPHHQHHKSHASGHHRTAVGQNEAVGSASASSLVATASKSSLTLSEGYADAGWALRKRYTGYWTNAEYRYLRAWRRVGNRFRFRYSFYGASVSGYGFVTVWKVPTYGDPRFVYSFSHYHYVGD